MSKYICQVNRLLLFIDVARTWLYFNNCALKQGNLFYRHSIVSHNPSTGQNVISTIQGLLFSPSPCVMIAALTNTVVFAPSAADAMLT